MTCSKKNRIVVEEFFFVLLLFGNWKTLANSHQVEKEKIRDVVVFRYIFWPSIFADRIGAQVELLISVIA